MESKSSVWEVFKKNKQTLLTLYKKTDIALQTYLKIYYFECVKTLIFSKLLFFPVEAIEKLKQAFLNGFSRFKTMFFSKLSIWPNYFTQLASEQLWELFASQTHRQTRLIKVPQLRSQWMNCISLVLYPQYPNYKEPWVSKVCSVTLIEQHLSTRKGDRQGSSCAVRMHHSKSWLTWHFHGNSEAAWVFDKSAGGKPTI